MFLLAVKENQNANKSHGVSPNAFQTLFKYEKGEKKVGDGLGIAASPDLIDVQTPKIIRETLLDESEGHDPLKVSKDSYAAMKKSSVNVSFGKAPTPIQDAMKLAKL